MQENKPTEWRGPLGWGLLGLGAIEKAVGWGGSIDFMLARSKDPGWVGTVIKVLADNLGLLFILAGVAFIVWNERRRTERLLDSRLPVGVGTEEQQAPDTNEEQPIRLFAGKMEPSFEEDFGAMEMFISVVNLGSTPVRMAHVEGAISLKADGGDSRRREWELPPPTLGHNPTKDGPLEHGYHGLFSVVQRFPAEVRALFPDTCGWKPYPSLEFGKLNIMFESEDRKSTYRLKLWDSIRLSAGEREIRARETTRLWETEEDRKKAAEALANLTVTLGLR